jgi:hypothetical protein
MASSKVTTSSESMAEAEFMGKENCASFAEPSDVRLYEVNDLFNTDLTRLEPVAELGNRPES